MSMSLEEKLLERLKESGFDTSMYEGLKYEQIQVIYDMLKDGAQEENIKKIADPSYSMSVMRWLGHYMEGDIDVTPYMHPNFGCNEIDELARALENNIEPSYSKETSTAEELFEARMDKMEEAEMQEFYKKQELENKKFKEEYDEEKGRKRTEDFLSSYLNELGYYKTVKNQGDVTSLLTEIRKYPCYDNQNPLVCGKMIVKGEVRWICQESLSYLDEPTAFEQTVYLKEPDRETSYELLAYQRVKRLFEKGVSDTYFLKKARIHWLDYEEDKYECMKHLIWVNDKYLDF